MSACEEDGGGSNKVTAAGVEVATVGNAAKALKEKQSAVQGVNLKAKLVSSGRRDSTWLSVPRHHKPNILPRYWRGA
ncbi:hypothetical protein LWI28_026792 [Acer negundo]|uniref:Uncharacterized protein n=1 Tax=Acer negundo TaxID=4023 RepID=A0AAD5JNB4_ACENE|nr:hypothetical protein LWI28_026792 [Acer negundo]